MKTCNKLILVVDDDPEIQSLLSRKFRADGHDVVCAADGMVCMSEIRRKSPDLVVLDLGIPAGDGFVVLERMQKKLELSDIPIIVLTGREIQGARARCMNGGARAFFEKSNDRSAFYTAVWGVLEGTGCASL